MTLDLTSAARPGHQETGPRIAPGRPSLVAASFLRHQPCDHGSPDGRHVSPSPTHLFVVSVVIRDQVVIVKPIAVPSVNGVGDRITSLEGRFAQRVSLRVRR